MKIETRIGNIGWALLAVMIPFGAATVGRLNWATPIAVTLMSIGFTAIAYCNFGWTPAGLQEDREIAAGYTTRPFPHRPTVDLVDPRDGFVIRPAGAAALTKEEYDAAIQAHKSELSG